MVLHKTRASVVQHGAAARSQFTRRMWRACMSRDELSSKCRRMPAAAGLQQQVPLRVPASMIQSSLRVLRTAAQLRRHALAGSLPASQRLWRHPAQPCSIAASRAASLHAVSAQHAAPAAVSACAQQARPAAKAPAAGDAKLQPVDFTTLAACAAELRRVWCPSKVEQVREPC